MANAKTNTLPLNSPKSLKNSNPTPVDDQSLARLPKGSRFSKESAKIKRMVLALALLLNAFHMTAHATAQCDVKDTAGGEKMVERINKRYDDFFRYQRHLEEREKERDKGRGENKKALQAHEKKIEQARLKYIKNRRPAPDRSDLEKKSEAEQKARKDRLEAARRCYVQQQSQVEGILKRGRMIPGNQEFGLDE